MGLASTLEQAMGVEGTNEEPSSAAAPASGGLAATLEAAYKSEAPKPQVSSRPSTPKVTDAGAFENLRGVGETALSTVSSLGSGIIGGWRGLATLASGGDMDQAAQAVNEETQKRTYQPETEMGKAGNEAMASPYNPLNWVGKVADIAGGATTDLATHLGASPKTAAAIGTGVNTAVNVAAPVAVLKGAGKVAPRIAPVEAPTTGADVAAGKPRIKLKVQEEAPAQSGATFQEVASSLPEGQTLPAAQQAERAALLKRVGLENVRQSAVTGDAKAAATDFQQSRMTGKAGDLMKQTLDSERGAVTRYAEKLVDDTGGSVGMDETARTNRGNTIVKPFQEIKNYFDKQTKALYAEADKRAAGQPIEATRLQSIVGDESEFLGTTEGEALLKGIKARMRALKMVDEEGKPLPFTVKEAERLSQYVGDQWQPRTTRLVNKIKNALEEDVTAAAGEDIYQKARAMRAMRSTVFENDLVDASGRQINNGLSEIVNASGRRLKLLKDVDKIPDAITSLPPDELQHVVETLKHAPKEIQPMAQEALSEIRSHVANKVLAAGSKTEGQWNAKGVTKELNNNAEKMKLLFSPDEMAKFKDLNDAGHILRHSQAYPGAAVQAHNLVQRGVMAGVKAGSTALGSAIGSVPGAVVGERLGSTAAAKLGEGMALRATQKRIVRLQDVAK